MIEAVAEHLQAVCDGEIRRLLINIPPRCSKSSLTSVAFPAWVWSQRHHSHTSGPLLLLDPAAGVDGQSPLTNLTPEAPWQQVASTAKDWDELGANALLRMLNHLHMVRAFEGVARASKPGGGGASMNSLASQSSSSGCVGGVPRKPKSDGVGTSGLPK